MPTFTYKGTLPDGTEVTETVEGADRYAAYDHARTLNHTIVSLEEVGGGFKKYFNMERINTYLAHVKQDEVVMFSRNLAAMLRAGLALTRSLSVSERQTKNLAMKEILRKIQKEIEKGKQFNAALKEYPKAFSPLYVSMVRAGEESGKLAEALETIAVQLQRSSTLQKKVRGAMMYPSIVILAMLLIGVLMMIYVVPTLTQTFRELNVELPLITRIILGVSDFLSSNTILTFLIMAAAAGGVVALYRTRFGRRAFEWSFLHMPVVGNIVKETNAARTTRTLSSLLQSGVDVVSALKITEDVVQNSFYREVIAKAAVNVEKGKPMSEDFAAHEHLYPVLVGEMMAVGEETGQIGKMLQEIADFYEAEVEQKTKDLSTIIEPILMVVIGGAVGLFALAMISPIYSISDSIG